MKIKSLENFRLGSLELWIVLWYFQFISFHPLFSFPSKWTMATQKGGKTKVQGMERPLSEIVKWKKLYKLVLWSLFWVICYSALVRHMVHLITSVFHPICKWMQYTPDKKNKPHISLRISHQYDTLYHRTLLILA